MHPCLSFGDMSTDIKSYRAGEAEFDSVVGTVLIIMERCNFRYTGGFCYRQQ